MMVRERGNPPRRTILAIASGKGGTGKTTVAAHLAVTASRTMRTLLVDLDVEAPDAVGYFPGAVGTGDDEAVTVLVPSAVGDRCTGCGACAKACRFGAIVAIRDVVTIDARVCKGCGRCVALCPAGVLVEAPVPVGSVRSFSADGGLDIVEGRMHVGDIRATAVIEAAKRAASRLDAPIQIRDCPPGVTCPTVHAVEGADYVVLVAEPTAFSLHDLDAALSMVRDAGIPAGVIVNKQGFGTADIEGLCVKRGVPVIGRIAFLHTRARAGAAARLWTDDPELSAVLDGALSAALDASTMARPRTAS